MEEMTMNTTTNETTNSRNIVVKKVALCSSPSWGEGGESVWLVRINTTTQHIDWVKIRGGDPDFYAIAAFLRNDRDVNRALTLAKESVWRIHPHVGMSGCEDYAIHRLPDGLPEWAVPYHAGDYVGRIHISCAGKVASDDLPRMMWIPAWDALLAYLDWYPGDGYRYLVDYPKRVEYPETTIVKR